MISFEGGSASNMAAGLSAARTQVLNNQGDRSSVPDAILVLTNKRPTSVAATLQSEISSIKSEGIYVMAIAIGENVDESVMTTLTSKPEEDFLFRIQDYTRLSDVANGVIDSSCEAVEPLPTSDHCKLQA